MGEEEEEKRRKAAEAELAKKKEKEEENKKKAAEAESARQKAEEEEEKKRKAAEAELAKKKEEEEQKQKKDAEAETPGESSLHTISKLVPGYIEKQDSLEAFDIDMTDPETKDKRSAENDSFTNKEDQEKNNKSVVKEENVKKVPEKEE